MSLFVIVTFILTNFNMPLAQADVETQNLASLHLPKPGVMVHLSPPMNPPMLKGIKVNPDHPFRFEFILDRGDGVRHSEQSEESKKNIDPSSLKSTPQDDKVLKDDANRLIKYFLASLTIPERDLWVNLSPYEKNRIVPESFGKTEMGRDLLAQDYMLKQITSSLIYPEDEIGKRFWKRIYEESSRKYGTTNIPVNTFNKVWIVPEKAVVYENAKAGTAYVVESRLKVMLEEDYVSLEKHKVILSAAKDLKRDSSSLKSVPQNDASGIGSQIIREIVIPELTKEINENQNFAQLRQVYNSLILATWYKKKIKDSILSRVYADKSKVSGIDINDPSQKDKIYQQYLQAFKKGVYNYIKEEIDPATQQPTPRKYFSGGMNMTDFAQMALTIEQKIDTAMLKEDGLMRISADLAMESNDVMFTFVGLAKVLRSSVRIWKEFKEELGEASQHEGDAKEITVKGEKFTLIKRLSGTNFVFTLSRSEFMQLANLKGWSVIQEFPEKDDDDILISAYGFDGMLRGGEKIWKEFKEKVGEASQHDGNNKEIIIQGEKFTLIKKLAGTNFVFTLSRSEFMRLANLKGWPILQELPEVSDDEAIFSPKGFAAVIKNGGRIWKEFKEEIGGASQHEGDTKEITIQGEKFTLIKKRSAYRIVFTLRKLDFIRLANLKGWTIILDIPKVTDDDVVFSYAGFSERLTGGRVIWQEFKEEVGEVSEHENGVKVIAVQGEKFNLTKKNSKGEVVFTIGMSEFRRLALLKKWAFIEKLLSVSDNDTVFSVKGFGKVLINGSNIWTKFKSQVGEAAEHEGNEKEIKIKGETFRLIKKRISNKTVFTLSTLDFRRLAELEGWKFQEILPAIESVDVAFSGHGFDEVIVSGHQKWDKFQPEVGEASNWPEKTKKYQYKGQEFTLIKKTSNTKTLFTLKRSEFQRLAELKEWDYREELPLMDTDDVSFSPSGFFALLINGDRLWDEFKKDIGDARKHKESTKDIEVNTEKFILIKKRNQNRAIVFTLKRDQFNKLAELKGWQFKVDLPKIDENDVPFTITGFAKILIGGDAIYEKISSTEKWLDDPGDEVKDFVVKDQTFKLIKKQSEAGGHFFYTLTMSDFQKIVELNGWEFRGSLADIDEDDVFLTHAYFTKTFVGGSRILNQLLEQVVLAKEGKGNITEIEVKGQKFKLVRKQSSGNIIYTLKEKELKLLMELSGWKLKANEVKPQKVKEVIEDKIQNLLSGHLQTLATRYSLNLKTIIWGLLGARIQGAYDRQELEKIINQQILSFVINDDEDVQSLGSATGDETSTSQPMIFEPTAITQDEISTLASNIEEELKREDIDAGIKELVRKQAGILFRKLEEQYFFKHYYKDKPDQFMAQEVQGAIEGILTKERNSITIEALTEVLNDVKEAVALQDKLHLNGLRGKTNLNLYQLMGILKAVQLKKVILADEMGLGKTLETLGTFLVSEAKEMLVVAPKIVLNRWMEDIANHTDMDLEVVILSDTEPTIQIKQNSKIEKKTFRNSQERYEYLASARPKSNRRRIILMNYDLLPNFNKYRIERVKDPIKVDFLALDEMHLIKKLDTPTAEAVYGDENGKGAIEAEYKMLISGTPLENKPSDLLGPLKFISRGGTSSAEKMFESMDIRDFSKMFASSRLETLSLLHSFIAERMIRRLKVEVMTGLPEKVYTTIKLDPLHRQFKMPDGKVVHLTGSYSRQLDLYEHALNDPKAFEQQIVNGHAPTETQDEETGLSNAVSATQLIRMEQAALDPSIFEEGVDSIKIDALKLLVEDRLKQNKSVIISTKYKTVAKRLEDILKKIYGKDSVAYLDGDVEDRQAELDHFQDKQARILLMTEVGTLGIEATQADSIILMNMPWKQSSFDQLIDRAHRRDPVRNYPGKKLEIINLEFDVPVSIDHLKARVIRLKSILSEMIVNGNPSPEILKAFKDNDVDIMPEILKHGDEHQIKWDNFEKSKIQELLSLLGRILHTKDPERQKELWNKAAEIYFLILQHKGSYFANLANLGILSGESFPELKGRILKTLDLGSGPSTLYRAYKHQRDHFKGRGLELDITDYDVSPQMLQFGEHRPGQQIMGGFDQLAEAFKNGEGSFDLVNLSFALRYTSHPSELIRQVRRVLKEGGVFTIILSNNNEVPPQFYQALQRAGFDLKVAQGAKLESMLDDETYQKIKAEHGGEIADDLAENVRGQFTYLVVKKTGSIVGEIKDEDFRLMVERPQMNAEKVEKLVNSSSEAKEKFIPHEAIVDGRVVYYSDIFDKEEEIQTVQISSSTEGGTEDTSIKLPRIITKSLARIGELSQRWQRLRLFNDKRSGIVQKNISEDVLTDLKKLKSVDFKSLNEQERLVLQERLEDILETPFFRLNPNDPQKSSHQEIINLLFEQLAQKPDQAMNSEIKDEFMSSLQGELPEEFVDDSVENSVFEKLKEDGLFVHGTGQDAGLLRMLSIIIDKMVRPVNHRSIFYIPPMDIPTIAKNNMYGPNYVVIDPRIFTDSDCISDEAFYPYSKGRVLLKAPYKYIKYFLVANKSTKEFIQRALEEATEIGLIDPKELKGISKKVLTYADYLKKGANNKSRPKKLEADNKTDTGGIDLTPANINLQTQSNGGKINFKLDPAMLQRLQNAPGFYPVIINIQPMTDIRLFLGLKEQETVAAAI